MIVLDDGEVWLVFVRCAEHPGAWVQKKYEQHIEFLIPTENVKRRCSYCTHLWYLQARVFWL